MQGILPNGNEVAVKQLFAKTSQGIDEFLNEVVLLTGMKHRNLVNLKGCCIREQQRLLVYEYVDNYDIDKVLLGKFNPHQAKISSLICIPLASPSKLLGLFFEGVQLLRSQEPCGTEDSKTCTS